MRQKLTLITLLMLLTGTATACDPDIFYLFRQDARDALDSLNKYNPGQISFRKAVLLHNLAFHKDQNARKEAEKMFDSLASDGMDNNLVRAFTGSLKMIQVSQSRKSSKIFKSLSPFRSSPRDDARKGFRMITEALESDPDNEVLRTLRATAAVESAEHLPEMFSTARDDLNWLEAHLDPGDTAVTFFTLINQAIYYCKYWQEKGGLKNLEMARQYIARARDFACLPSYKTWVETWEKRIADAAQNARK